MSDKEFSIGDIVIPIAGRDTDKKFIIVGILPGGYVAIADGCFHKLSNPKKKNPKHLRDADMLLENIALKLSTGKKVFDSELASALKKISE